MTREDRIIARSPMIFEPGSVFVIVGGALGQFGQGIFAVGLEIAGDGDVFL